MRPVDWQQRNQKDADSLDIKGKRKNGRRGEEWKKGKRKERDKKARRGFICLNKLPDNDAQLRWMVGSLLEWRTRLFVADSSP